MPEHSDVARRWAKPRSRVSSEAGQDQAKASKELVRGSSAALHSAENHPDETAPLDACETQVFAPPPCGPVPCDPATSAIVPMRLRRGADHARSIDPAQLIGACACLELDMGCSVMEFFRISELAANYPKPRGKNSPKMLQCGRCRNAGSQR